MGAVSGLGLGGGVPPGIEMNHGVGGGQVESGAAGLQRDQHDLGPALLEIVDGSLPIPGGAGQGDPAHTARGERVAQ